jgi:hypothetical protein
MWKILVAFIIFAAVGLFVLKKAGGDVNMGGESHDVTGGHAASAPAAPELAAAPASAASQ